jgi:hypothetical protein
VKERKDMGKCGKCGTEMELVDTWNSRGIYFHLYQCPKCKTIKTSKDEY